MPRWLLLVIAACSLAATAGLLLHLRWQPTMVSGVYLDTWRSRVCTTTSCRAIGERLPLENPFDLSTD